jgi:hypothetical protein
MDNRARYFIRGRADVPDEMHHTQLFLRDKQNNHANGSLVGDSDTYPMCPSYGHLDDIANDAVPYRSTGDGEAT